MQQAIEDTELTGSEQSLPSTKRLKSSHTACDCSTFSICDDATHTTGTTGNSIDIHTVSPKSYAEDFPIMDDLLLQNIFSFVGEDQYRFVGSVNRHFQTSYVSLYPEKTTKFNASTMKLAKLCREDIDARKTADDKINKEHLRFLWHSAAQYGKIDIVKYLYESCDEKSFYLDRNSWCDRYQGESLHCIYYEPHFYSDWRYDLCHVAAKYSQIELLQWAYDNDLFIQKDDRRVCEQASTCGHLEVLHWVVNNGFGFNTYYLSVCLPAAFVAARKGQLDLLKWYHELRCEVDEDADASQLNTCCTNAAKGGHLEVVQWLYSIGCEMDDTTFYWAVRRNHVDIVKYMLDTGFERVDWAGQVAAKWGCLETLQLLHSLNFELGKDVMNNAAFGGHFDIIEWALEIGFRLTKATCYFAAAGGHLDTLMWLRAKGCPWSFFTTKYAKTEEIYSYAKCNGCPVAEGNPRKKISKMRIAI